MLTIGRLSHDDALVLLDGAEAKSREIGVPMCIAVTDESGNLIAFRRMDGSKVLSVTLSQDKAMTAAVVRRATHDVNAACLPGQPVFGIQNAMGGRFSTVGGGYPVVVDGETVGGIGCSSGSVDQDMACAAAGLAAFMAKRA